MRYLTFLFCINLIAISCNQTSNEDSSIRTLNFDPDEARPYKVTELFSKIEVVPLEFTEESMVAKPRVFSISKDRIYVLISEQGKGVLMVFDRKGNYLWKTSIGKGPGEFVSVASFSLSESGEEITIFDLKSRNFFDKNGNHLRREKLAFASFLLPPCSIDSLTFGMDIKNDLFIVGKNEIRSRISLTSTTDYYARPVLCYNENIYFTIPFQSGIYTLENETPKLYYNLNFGSSTFNQSSKSILDINLLQENWYENKVCNIICKQIDANNMIMSARVENKPCLILTSLKKENHKKHIIYPLFPSTIIEIYAGLDQKQKDELEAIDPDLNNILSKVKIDDNPIVVIGKIK